MKFVSFCNSCGRTVEKDFIYCPWCGIERLVVNIDEKSMFDNVFNQLEEKQSINRTKRLREMESKLEALEKELDTLALIAESRECQHITEKS